MRRNEGDYEQLKMVREHPVSSSTTCLRIKTSCPTGVAAFLLQDYESFDVIAGSRLLILSVSLTNVRSFQISRRCRSWEYRWEWGQEKKKRSKTQDVLQINLLRNYLVWSRRGLPYRISKYLSFWNSARDELNSNFLLHPRTECCVAWFMTRH